MTDLERLTRDYWQAAQRVRRLRIPAPDKALALADLAVIYRAEVQRLTRAKQPREKWGRMLGRSETHV